MAYLDKVADRMLNSFLSTFRNFENEQNFLDSFAFDETSAQTVTEKDGQKFVNFHFDVSGFQPEEIDITTLQSKELHIKAIHESKSEGSTVRREYKRVVNIPENVKVEELKSFLSPEGVLSVSAPLLEPQNEKEKSENIEKRTGNIDMSIAHE